MPSSSSRYFVASVVCIEAELPLIQQTLQTFPEVQGAVTFDAGKARFCISLEKYEGASARILIERIRSTLELVLSQLRSEK